MSKPQAEAPTSEYLQKFRGSFTSTMQWQDLSDLWGVLENDPSGWYVYAIGEPVPERVFSESEFFAFIGEVDELLRREHEESYCGIVYADNLRAPSMVKIYDPNNLGVSCGYSENPPLPGWVLSRLAPESLESNQVLPANRRRWWRRLFGA